MSEKRVQGLVNHSRPKVGVLYYRAQHLAGNTRYVEALCEAIDAAGADPMPIYCASLRTAEPELLKTLGEADALVVTVLAAGGTKPATAGAGGDDEQPTGGQIHVTSEITLCDG